MRIHIIGGPGSGKTTLAKKIVANRGLPYMDLDDIQWDNSRNTYGHKNPEEIRDAALLKFLKGNSLWVIEGTYVGWLLPSFSAANIVIILLTPLWLRQFRVLRRSLRRKLGFEKSKHESLADICTMLSWNAKWEKEKLPRALKILTENKIPYRICKSQREVQNILAS